MTVRVRFAPSPTGRMHIGNARTALFNYLFARARGGVFVLRIEDTDRARSTEESEAGILRAMEWLGLTWDEGPGKGGAFGPYRQSERLELYRRAAEKLLMDGHAYRCFCSSETSEGSEELAGSGEETDRTSDIPGRKEKEGDTSFRAGDINRAGYRDPCREISASESHRRALSGEPFGIRLKVEPGTVKFHDLIRGDFEFDNSNIPDLVLVRRDGLPTYNFACVVDDAEMKITHVIRGDDHISNTPKQILIYRWLGYELPRFAHLPMILGPDGSRLSKRHGATSVEEFRSGGILAPALVNYLALLGWSPKSDREIFTLAELEKIFELSDAGRSPSIFDPVKLKWMNGIYIRELPADEYFSFAYPVVMAGPKGNILRDWPEKRIRAMLESVRTAVHCAEDIHRETEIFFARPSYRFLPEYEKEMEEGHRVALPVEKSCRVLKTLLSFLEGKESFTGADLKAFVKQVKKELDAPQALVYMSLRIALTGRTSGPSLTGMIEGLSVPEIRERIFLALEAWKGGMAAASVAAE